MSVTRMPSAPTFHSSSMIVGASLAGIIARTASQPSRARCDTVGLSMPGVIAATLIVFIPTVGDYVTPELVGDGKEPMIANLIETQLLKLRNFAQGSAFAVASMLMVGIVSLIFVLLNRRFIGGVK